MGDLVTFDTPDGLAEARRVAPGEWLTEVARA
jgi:hypothetical protein